MKDREPRTTRDNVGTVLRVTAGVVLAFSGAMAFRQDQAQGIAPYSWTPYEGPLTPVLPSKTSEPLQNVKIIDTKRETDLTGENQDNSPGGGTDTVDVSPSPTVISSPEPRLSPQEQQIQNLQAEAAQYVQVAQESGKFSDIEIANIRMYAPMCIPPARERDIIWEACMITIQEETGASDSIKAFNGQTAPYYGIAQRNVLIWPESYVADAAKGFEYLAKLPQRHPDDWREIAAMTKMLADNYHRYEPEGKNNALFLSLKLFTGSEILARQRLDEILQMEKLLERNPDSLQKNVQ